MTSRSDPVHNPIHNSYIKIAEPGDYVIGINGKVNLTSDGSKNNGGIPVRSKFEIRMEDDDGAQLTVFDVGFIDSENFNFFLEGSIGNKIFSDTLKLLHGTSAINGNFLILNIKEPCTLTRTIYTGNTTSWIPCNIYRIQNIPQNYEQKIFDLTKFSYFDNNMSMELRKNGLYINGHLIGVSDIGAIVLNENTIVEDSFVLDAGVIN